MECSAGSSTVLCTEKVWEGDLDRVEAQAKKEFRLGSVLKSHSKVYQGQAVVIKVFLEVQGQQGFECQHTDTSRQRQWA